MQSPPPQPTQLARWGFWVLLTWVIATALQLQQARLFSGWVYGAMLIGAAVFAGLAITGKRAPRGRGVALIFAVTLLAFAATGLRAHLFLDQSLDAKLQGQDITVTGVIAAMVQRNETGVRFRLDVNPPARASRKSSCHPKST